MSSGNSSAPNTTTAPTIISQFSEYRVGKALMLYVPPVLFVVGFLGNSISFVVMRHKNMVTVSSRHYLAWLAVADSLYLLIGLLPDWLEEVTGKHVEDSAGWVCKLFTCIELTAGDFSVWLIVAVTVERYVVVCFPLESVVIVSTQLAKKVICIVALLMFAINLHFFWTMEIVQEFFDGRNVYKCDWAPQLLDRFVKVWQWVDACVYVFLPFILILVFNILIIKAVAEAQERRQRMLSALPLQLRPSNLRQKGEGEGVTATHPRCEGYGEGTRLTALLLTVSFTFMLTMLPVAIYYIVDALCAKRTARVRAQFELAQNITCLLMYVNHSINFFLYCMTGNKFRQQMLDMFWCLRTNTVEAA